jgi:hypothetical protein
VPDWLTAFDDCLAQRWTRCIFCRAPAVHVELRTTGDSFAMTMGLCIKCEQADGTEEKREALVAQHARTQATTCGFSTTGRTHTPSKRQSV